MEINFEKGFFRSLENLIKRERWYNKAFDAIRYDIPRFCKNLWLFRKDLYNYHWYGGEQCMSFTRTALDHMQKNISMYGMEVESSSNKKVAKMQRAVYILNQMLDDTYIELAEKELGKLVCHPWEFEPAPDNPGCSQMVNHDTPEEAEHNSKVFERTREIQKQLNDELWQILKGQDYSDFKGSGEDDWDQFFDGSGLNTWWD